MHTPAWIPAHFYRSACLFERLMAAGGTSIMQVISPRTPAAKRLPFPHIRAIFLLIETHSAATAFSRAGKWQVKIWRHLSPSSLPPSGKSGCEVDKFFEGNWSLSSEDNRRFWGYGEVTAHILPCLCNQPGPNVCTPLWLSYSEGFCGEKRRGGASYEGTGTLKGVCGDVTQSASD